MLYVFELQQKVINIYIITIKKLSLKIKVKMCW